MSILDEIILHKKKEVVITKEKTSIKDLELSQHFKRSCISVSERIFQKNYPSIIAEFKRKSPSKKDINITANALGTCLNYQDAGATAISILTDEKYFGGRNTDIINVRDQIHIPILRKEFIVDEYQLIEAKSIGADFILLVAECLSKESCKSLATLAKNLGLEVLLEMHNVNQIDKINDNIQLVGINNRNLETFETTIETSLELIDQLPQDIIKISESGISTLNEIKILYNFGYKGFLIGESLMKDDTLLRKVITL